MASNHTPVSTLFCCRPLVGWTRRCQNEPPLICLCRCLQAISWMDSQLSRVTAELTALGLANDTLVVFHADHGWSLGEYGEWEKVRVFCALLSHFGVTGTTHAHVPRDILDDLCERLFRTAYPRPLSFESMNRPSALQFINNFDFAHVDYCNSTIVC